MATHVLNVHLGVSNALMQPLVRLVMPISTLMQVLVSAILVFSNKAMSVLLVPTAVKFALMQLIVLLAQMCLIKLTMLASAKLAHILLAIPAYPVKEDAFNV